MAITNVKILLRRGLREEIGVDTLETGEMGFTTDTNQLFVGIDDAIDEIQFDAFANAHAVIQTWLDSDDNSEPGLKIDEDLVIRNVQDIDALIEAMHFYLQNVEWKGNVQFTVGETLYLKEYKYAQNRIPSSEIDPGKTYIIKKIGNTEYRTMGAPSNDINLQFTSIAVGPLNGNGEVLEVIGVEDYTHGVVTSVTYDSVRDITVTSLYMKHNDAMPSQDIAPNDTSTYMNKSNFGLFKWDSTEWVPEVIDHVLNYHPLNTNINYTTIPPQPISGLGTNSDIAVITGPDRVTYWYKQDTAWQQLGSGVQDFQFHTTDIETQDLDITPLSTPSLRSDGSPLVTNDYYIDYSRDVQNGLSLVLSEFDLLSPRVATVPLGSDLSTMTIEEINNYYRYDDTTLPTYRTETIAAQNTLDYQLTYAEPETSEVGLATIYIKEKDQPGSNDFTLYDYSNTHRAYYYTKSLVGSPSDVDYADTTDVGFIEVPEFTAPFYARSRRNVEVLTENTYNQIFADQHLSSHSHHSGKRSSLFKKTFEIPNDIFLRYHFDICTTFFIDYSLIQRGDNKVFVRAGQIKIINGHPHGIPQVKLTDEHTEIWQDFNTDNIAEMYPNPLYPEPPAVPAPPVAPEVEFSNIQFDVKREDTVRLTATTKELVDAWLLTSANTTVGAVATQSGDDVIISNANPQWDVQTFISDVSGVFTATAEKGDDLQIYFTQDANYNTEISYTLRRWSM